MGESGKKDKMGKECTKRDRFLSKIISEKHEWGEEYEKISDNFKALKEKLNALKKIMDTMEAFRQSPRSSSILRNDIPRFLANLKRTEAELKELHGSIRAFKTPKEPFYFEHW